MIDDIQGSFTLDAIVAYTAFIIVLVCVFSASIDMVSGKLNDSRSTGLDLLASQIGDQLLRSPGHPEDWHMSRESAGRASMIGLSAGSPNVLSSDKVLALSYLRPDELIGCLNLNDPCNRYGIRIEVRPCDGSALIASGMQVSESLKDVTASTRAACIRHPDGTFKNAVVKIYLWRERTGTEAVIL